MRGKGLVILLVVLFFWCAAPAPQAALVNGTWDLISQLSNGSWTEYKPGGDGTPGSILTASSSDAGEWSLVATLQSATTYSGSGGWQYQTTYAIGDDPATTTKEFGSAVTAPGPWGDAVLIEQATGTNLSKRDPTTGNLAWLFSFTGLDKASGKPVTITAEFDSITPEPASATYTDFGTYHTGGFFKSLQMTVVPIPGAVWLLGGGLVCLVALRRKGS